VICRFCHLEIYQAARYNTLPGIWPLTSGAFERVLRDQLPHCDIEDHRPLERADAIRDLLLVLNGSRPKQ
jgi:hypothetical protein